MKKFHIIIATMIILFFIAGCQDQTINEPYNNTTVGYSGEYKNVFYNDGKTEPTVELTILQNESTLTGTGYFNDVPFNFTGTLKENHAFITFDLLNTNAGDFNNCIIDGFFGTNNTFAGGYCLSPIMGTEKIRFQQVQQ